MIKRIYIDTSVFGGYFDKEFDTETIPFFEYIFLKQIKILVSDILELELGAHSEKSIENVRRQSTHPRPLP
jgi:hypothetical protein